MTAKESSVNEEQETEDGSDSLSSDGSLTGIKLRNQREKLNMKIDEVASNLNLDVSYIQAIETNDFSNISSTSYVYGYIRSYAKLLKLPEQEILDSYQYDKSETSKLLPDYMGNRKTYSDASSSNATWALLFAIVTGVLFLGWWFIQQ